MTELLEVYMAPRMHLDESIWHNPYNTSGHSLELPDSILVLLNTREELMRKGRLSDAQIDFIRISDELEVVLAHTIGISQAMVGRIRRGLAYKEVPWTDEALAAQKARKARRLKSLSARIAVETARMERLPDAE